MSATSEHLHELHDRKTITVRHYVWLAAVAALTGFVLMRYASAMDGYEIAITIGTGISRGRAFAVCDMALRR